jgi:hypothetical protein
MDQTQVAKTTVQPYPPKNQMKSNKAKVPPERTYWRARLNTRRRESLLVVDDFHLIERVHYAAYQFADLARLDAALNSDGYKMLVAEFDQAWPHGVSRTRDRLEMVEERGG